MPKKQGHLVIVGGPESRVPEREILTRAAHLAGGASTRVCILAAGKKANADHLSALGTAFDALGVRGVTCHLLADRKQVDAPEVLEAIDAASCVVLTAADPADLAKAFKGTTAERRVHEAFERRGACVMVVGGASSGISRHMVAEGKSDIHPRAGLISLTEGLGFLDRVVIDHHFSDKQRMGRLLSIVAQKPDLIGVGVDARTAMVVTPGRRLEVIGQATVTILDGRTMSYCSAGQVPPDAILAMGNVQLHLLPAGFAFDLEGGLPPSRGVIGAKVPPALHEVVSQLVSALPFKP
ncbi:MAG: cphB [Cyanobacteria bacterium RYN_339]|nr:cphB [Cyanobacteria bacterium RYN_339]